MDELSVAGAGAVPVGAAPAGVAAVPPQPFKDWQIRTPAETHSTRMKEADDLDMFESLGRKVGVH
jgi:hypothetical protein